MAKSISLQLKDALEELDGVVEQRDAFKESHTKIANELTATRGELGSANEKISELESKLRALVERDLELSQSLANAEVRISELEAEAKTVTETASVEAQRIVADIGVPPVTADAAEQPRPSDLTELWSEWQTLNSTDPRAAGRLYSEKIRPLVFQKESK